MEKLTTREYWDTIYQRKDSPQTPPARPVRSGWKARGKAALRPAQHFFRRYGDYLLWERLLPQHLPRTPDLRAVEIGSAPGWFMVRLHQRFGYDVYGIEYAETGVAKNQRVFREQGLKAENVWHMDFFADELHRQHAGKFDIVVSRGFIEHFDNPAQVIEKHLNLLAPGGTLLVSIPNKRGVNWLFTRLFHKRALEMHNLEIMKGKVFRSLFDERRLETRYCGYIGLFSFNQFNTPPGSLAKPLLVLGKLAQLPLNALFRLLFPRGGVNCPWTSPHLLYIGVKK